MDSGRTGREKNRHCQSETGTSEITAAVNFGDPFPPRGSTRKATEQTNIADIQDITYFQNSRGIDQSKEHRLGRARKRSVTEAVEARTRYMNCNQELRGQKLWHYNLLSMKYLYSKHWLS